MESTQSSKQEFFQSQTKLVRASNGQRLANYFIDAVLFNVILLIFWLLILYIYPSEIDNSDSSFSGFKLIDRIITLLLYGMYMGTVESIFNGKSLGKLITGTKAVNLDGTNISTGTAFERGFFRAIPFCVFSAFGTPCNPWQDEWTNTMVIDEKMSK